MRKLKRLPQVIMKKLIGIVAGIGVLYMLLRQTVGKTVKVANGLLYVPIITTDFIKEGGSNFPTSLKVTVNITVKNTANTSANFRQPFVKLYSKPAVQRTEADEPIALSNLENTIHPVQAFSEITLSPIVFILSPTQLFQLGVNLFQTKTTKIYLEILVGMDGFNKVVEQEVEINPLKKFGIIS